MTDNDVKKLIDAMKDVFPTAEMVQHGFDETAKKADVDARFDKVEERLDRLDTRMGRVEGDLAELKDNLVYRDEFDDLMARVKFVETKLGIVSGK